MNILSYLAGRYGDKYPGRDLPAYLMGKAAGSAAVVWKTVSEALVHITDALARPAKSLIVKIEPVQEGSGDPSPTNVRPINGWTAAKVTRTGKNLCVLYTQRDSHQGINYAVTSDGIHVYGTATDSSYSWVGTYSYEDSPIHLKAGTYKFSVTDMIGANQQDAYLVFMGKTKSGTNLGNVAVMNGITTSVTKTFTEDVGLFYGFFVRNGLSVDKVVKVQIELGSTATDYEAYQGKTFTQEFVDAQGNPLTVYGGESEIVGGKLTSRMAMVDMGSLGWVKSADEGFYRSDHIIGIKQYTAYYQTLNYLSDIFTIGTTNSAPQKNGELTQTINTDRVIARLDSAEDLSEFIEAVSGHYLLYELAEPIEYTLAPQTVTLFAGENNIWNDVGETEITYAAQ